MVLGCRASLKYYPMGQGLRCNLETNNCYAGHRVRTASSLSGLRTARQYSQRIFRHAQPHIAGAGPPYFSLLSTSRKEEGGEAVLQFAHLFHWRMSTRFLVNMGPVFHSGLRGFGDDVTYSGTVAGALAGVRYGLDFDGPLSLEGSGGALVSTRDVVDPRRPEGNRVIGETDAVLAILDARLKLSLTGGRTRNGFQPFLMVGAGLAWDSSAGSTLEQDLPAADRFDFGTTFGLGVFFLGRLTTTQQEHQGKQDNTQL